MSRTALQVVSSGLLIALGTLGCSPAPSGEELMHGPPLATGEVCVDATPANAVITVNGEVMTQRCQTFTTSYSSSASVQVTAPGYVSQTLSAPLVGGTESFTIALVAEATE
jgi:hypothetical protein